MGNRSGLDAPAGDARSNPPLTPLEFDQVKDWSRDRHQSAFECFVKSAKRMISRPYTTKSLGVDAKALAGIGQIAIDQQDRIVQGGDDEARRFFETHFRRFYLLFKPEDLLR